MPTLQTITTSATALLRKCPQDPNGSLLQNTATISTKDSHVTHTVGWSNANAANWYLIHPQ